MNARLILRALRRRPSSRVAMTAATALSMLLGLPAIAAATVLHATPGTLASTFASAQGGDTILLASGSYGTWSGGSKASPVTLSPEAGASPAIGVDFGSNVSNVTLDGFAAVGGQNIAGSKNVTISNSTFTDGLAITGSNTNVVLDHDTFNNLGQATWEGRLSIQGSGVTVKNSLFSGNAGCSDGIFVGGSGNTIGPGNEFTGIKQASCSSHDDSIQLYTGPRTTIIGNYFHDSDTNIMAPDGGDHSVISDNVFVVSGYEPAVQLGSHIGTTFIHNTVVGIDVHMDSKSGSPASSGGVLRDNVMVRKGTGASFDTTSGSGCSGCTTRYNLFSASADVSGTNSLLGTPVFVGGTNPTTYAGYQLAAGSPGKNNASDGTDRGARTVAATP